MTGALEGIKVLDFSTLLPGPMASLFLADAGADVVKIERPGAGDEMRNYTPKFGECSVNFAMLNHGKSSLALDLKNPASLAVLEPLFKEADILIEQFRPGVMARLGLGYDDIRQLNPNIIYCSITGYGQTGPKAQRAGHDLNYAGDTGLLALSHGSTEHPVLPGALLADIAGGTYPALLNILLALRVRDAGKGGAHLDIAMAENLFPFMYWAMGDGQAANAWPGNGDALTTGGSPRYALYPTSDGRILAAAPIEQGFWTRFCDAIGLAPDLREDSADPEVTRAAIAAIIAGEPATHWEAVFDKADCCCSIMRTIREALDDAHFSARGTFARRLFDGQGQSIIALPSPINPALRASTSGDARAPHLGEHNSEFAQLHPVAAQH